MFDLSLFLKPQKQLFVITAEKNIKVSGMKLNTDSTFQGFSIHWLLFYLYQKTSEKWNTTGQEGHFITEHPCLEGAQLSKGGTGSGSAWCAVGVPGDSPLHLPLMQTRAQELGSEKQFGVKGYIWKYSYISALKMTMSKIKVAPSSINSILWQPQHIFNVKNCSLKKILY